MGTRVNKIKTQFTRLNFRYYFSTFQNPNPNELYILNQLSHLLPIKLNKQISENFNQFDSNGSNKVKYCLEKVEIQNNIQNSENFNQFDNKDEKIKTSNKLIDYSENDEIKNNSGKYAIGKLNEKFSNFSENEKNETRVSNKLNYYLEKEEIGNNSVNCAKFNENYNQFHRKGEKVEIRVTSESTNSSSKLNDFLSSNVSGKLNDNFSNFSKKEEIETRVRVANENNNGNFDNGNDLLNVSGELNENFDHFSGNDQNETRVRNMNKFIFPNDIVGNVYVHKIREKIINGTRVTEKALFDELDVKMVDKVVYRRRNSMDFRQRLNKEEMETRVRDVEGFLSPEDKLRGVFLQKMKGKSAIENALENVGVELTIETLAKVVDRGNLGGDAIVAFFNWAIKQPGIDECDISCYHIVLKALGRRKLFDFMMGVLRDMVGNGVRPSLGTIEIVMDSYIRTNHLSKAMQIFGNLEEYGLSCDVDSLNVLVGCLCKRSHVGAANGLVNRMKEKIVLNKVSYDIIISGWSRLGKISEMETNLREMIAGEFEPDCLTFSYVIEGLGRAREIDDAVEVSDGMSGRGCVPDVGVYNAMIFNFVSVGDFDKAVEYYRLMLKNECQPNMETYSGLINGFLKARKVADAVEIFDEMLGRGLVPSPGTVTSFIEPLCSYGPPHAALMIYKKATKVGVKVTLSAYKLLLMRLSRFGKCGMLLNMWDEMQKSGYASDVEVYEYIINGLSNVGQLENAILVMEESMRKGFCPSKLICSKLNHKLMSSDKVESAYKLFLKVRKARVRENERRLCRARGWHF